MDSLMGGEFDGAREVTQDDSQESQRLQDLREICAAQGNHDSQSSRDSHASQG